MSSIAWFDSAFSLQLTTVFLHFLWQGCLIGAIVLVGNALLKRATAKRRYLFNLFALGSLVACVPVTFLLVERPTVPATELALNQKTDVEPGELLDRAPLLADSDQPTEVFELDQATFTSASFDSSETLVVSARSESQPNFGLDLTDLTLISPYFVACYLLGVFVMLVRLTLGIWGGHRLRTRTKPVEDRSILNLLADQVERFGIKFMPAIAWCEEVSVPVVVGIVKPMILLPVTLTNGLTPDQVHALLTHELAHIRRFDLFANLFQRLVEALLFFHPVVWFVSRRVSIEREHAADDMVLEAGWQRTDYADALVRMAELSAAIRSGGISNHTLSLAATGTSSSEFKRRVLRLLDLHETPRLSLTSAGLLSLIVVGASLVATPLIVKSWADDKDRDHSDQPEPTTQFTEYTDLYQAEGSGLEGEDLYFEVLAEELLFTQLREDERYEQSSEIVQKAATTDRASSIDKAELPKVAKNFKHDTRVSSSLITGGGIIERIEENTIHFRSGDRIEFGDGTHVFFRPEPGKPPRTAKASDLEPRMVISYSLRRGHLERLMLVGIVDDRAESTSVFDKIKQLQLKLGNEQSTSLDGRFPMKIAGKSGEVEIKIGETKLIELAKPTEQIEWRVGEYTPEGVEDIEPFDYLLVQWRENGRVTWTCYRSPQPNEFQPPPRPKNPSDDSDDSAAKLSESLLIIRPASLFSKTLAEASERYEHSSRLFKKGYVPVSQLDSEKRQLAILQEELATQIRLLELEVNAVEKDVASKQSELKRILQLAEQGVIATSKIPAIERDAAQSALRLEKIKNLLKLYQKVQSTYDSSEQESDESSTRKTDSPMKPATTVYATEPARTQYHQVPVTEYRPITQPQIVTEYQSIPKFRSVTESEVQPTKPAIVLHYQTRRATEQLNKQNDELKQQANQLKQMTELEKSIDLATGEKRTELLWQAMGKYELLAEQHRSDSIGVWSRFYQARCLWKLGKVDEAEKILNELLDRPIINDTERKLLEDLQKRISQLRKSEKSP